MWEQNKSATNLLWRNTAKQIGNQFSQQLPKKKREKNKKEEKEKPSHSLLHFLCPFLLLLFILLSLEFQRNWIEFYSSLFFYFFWPPVTFISLSPPIVPFPHFFNIPSVIFFNLHSKVHPSSVYLNFSLSLSLSLFWNCEQLYSFVLFPEYSQKKPKREEKREKKFEFLFEVRKTFLSLSLSLSISSSFCVSISWFCKQNHGLGLLGFIIDPELDVTGSIMLDCETFSYTRIVIE